ncbi:MULTISPECIES: ABC transporter permease subunit [unclassified Lysinibacillus]|uniref:ABC transporter permease n=1 Tax=unclassified Lysinibacillus TaxID=2636778 RepID=UPI00255316CD|nr:MULTISPECIES: ABC transporter permease subunit [unclassified Lysinibacillus]MDM5250452.1 ABC transporter permease subunit [Lysinibacillus sp. G4S2]
MYSMLIKLELKQMLRSRWMQLVGILFTFVFTAIIVIQQMALPDVEGFTRQTASFLNVLLFLLPLFILTIGSMSVAGDVESGWYSLLKTYPMTRKQYILGKYMASVLAFLLVVVVAFGAILALGGFLGGVRLPFIFIILTLLCIFIFVSLAIAVGAFAKTRLFALSLSLVFWSIFLLLISYALMAIGTVVAGHVLQKLTIIAIHINPVEWLRFGYFIFTDQASVLGPAFYNITQFYSSPLGYAVYVAVTLLWIVCPLAYARVRLSSFNERR